MLAEHRIPAGTSMFVFYCLLSGYLLVKKCKLPSLGKYPVLLQPEKTVPDKVPFLKDQLHSELFSAKAIYLIHLLRIILLLRPKI